MTTEVDDFLEHYGVKGMRWGKRGASTVAESLGLSKGATPRDKAGNIKKPSYGRQVLLGTATNSKKRFTDPKALATRTASGKLAAAAFLTGLGGTALGAIAGSSKNSSVAAGAAMAAKLLNSASGAAGTAAAVSGIVAVRQERVARSNKD